MVKKSNIIYALLLVTVITGGVVLYERQPSSDIPGYTQKPTPSIKSGASSSPKPSATKPSATAPTTLSLKVPFTPQAPTGNWDKEHNEACEEASALMAAAYFNGDTRSKIPAAEVEQELTRLFEWERANFGYSLDTNSVETAEMIRSVYGLKTKIINDYTEDDIKQAIRENKVVIVLAAGRKLGNPNYTAPGPLYHMLVVRGYTATKIITNDPGTRNGENYQYSFATLKNAPADWDHATNTIDESKSVIIVVSK